MNPLDAALDVGEAVGGGVVVLNDHPFHADFSGSAENAENVVLSLANSAGIAVFVAVLQVDKRNIFGMLLEVLIGVDPAVIDPIGVGSSLQKPAMRSMGRTPSGNGSNSWEWLW